MIWARYRVLLCASIVGGLVGPRGLRAQHDDLKQAVVAVERLGGTLERDARGAGNAVIAVSLRNTRATDVELSMLKSLTGLRSLDVAYTSITNAGVERLTSLRSLQELRLRGCQVTDDGMVGLEGLTILQILDLGLTAITDKGLEHLKAVKSLRSLQLTKTRVTDAGLMHLQALRGLRVLDLRGTKITDKG